MKAVPKPIAMEPCWGSRAGVLTVLLYLPRVPSGTPPPGQSGLSLCLCSRTLQLFGKLLSGSKAFNTTEETSKADRTPHIGSYSSPPLMLA
ncbi:hypothetical protein KUCAC02_035497, partial [Chaenocephalus aceratus]